MLRFVVALLLLATSSSACLTCCVEPLPDGTCCCVRPPADNCPPLPPSCPPSPPHKNASHVASSPALRASICEHVDTKALTAVRGACPLTTVHKSFAGVNIFDQLWLGSSGEATTGGYADAKSALLSAQRTGVKVFRFFAGLWGPNQAYWATNPTTFWSEFDRLMDDIEATGMYCIPSIGTGDWHSVANRLHPGLNETKNDAIRNTSSIGYKLNIQYFDEIIVRYRNRSSVLFWELGNELNLGVNLPVPWCGATQKDGKEPCYNTQDMVTYTTALVNRIRSNDPVRPVSSGFSLTRQFAWHQEYCSDPKSKQTVPGCADGFYGYDTQEQWRNISANQQQAVDIMSAHHYAPSAANRPGCWFNKDPASPLCINNASLITVVAEVAAANGQMAYIGEYGGPGPSNFTGPTIADQQFGEDLLNIQVKSVAAAKAGVPGAAPVGLTTAWAWACPAHRSDMVCIWPNSTVPKEAGSNRMIQLLANANDLMDKL